MLKVYICFTFWKEDNFFLFCNICYQTKIRIYFQINFAIGTDRLRSQWIDLGNHTEACMTNPGTCGKPGGAISLWFKLIDSGYIGAVFSTMKHFVSVGLVMHCDRSGNIG